MWNPVGVRDSIPPLPQGAPQTATLGFVVERRCRSQNFETNSKRTYMKLYLVLSTDSARQDIIA